MKEVFLGGTCNMSTWREERLIPMLRISAFNPVVDDWDDDRSDEYMARELAKREECDFCLYVITPKMTGVYSIAEVVEDSIRRPEKTVFCFLTEDDGQVFTKDQVKSLNAVSEMVARNGATVCYSLEEVADFLNHA